MAGPRIRPVAGRRSLVLLRENAPRIAAKLAGTARPANAAIVARNAAAVARRAPGADYVARNGRSLDEAERDAVDWVCRAQDAAGTGGVASYEFYGWSSGYPEVTGYLIPTLWDLAHARARNDLGDRAIRMAEWELRIQKPEGGWESGYEGAGRPAVVFNTGQVVRGMVRTHEETGEDRYADAAVRAADWIVACQEPDGSWAKTNYRGLRRVYDSYVAAPLARLAALTGNDAYAEAASRSCEFVLRHQRANGWFELCDNSRHFNDAPSTHTLCYTIDGLLETGELLEDERFVEAGKLAADALAARVDASGRLPGRLDAAWRPRVRWVCLTGSAQLGVALLRVGGAERVATARRLLDFLVFAQDLNGVSALHRGGLAGSYPIWGAYSPLTLPCWAPKYFLDLVAAARRTTAAVAPSQPARA